MSWVERAACKGLPIEVFFPPETAPYQESKVLEEARAICARCPVVSECLEADLHFPKGDRWGFRAGMTETERRKLPGPSRRALAGHGTEACYRRHRRHGESPCPACVQGHSRRMAEAKTQARQKRRAA